MIKLDQRYARQDLIDFLQNTFLQDYIRDVRPVGTQGLSVISKATSLGRSDSLDLQIFEFEYTGSANKRVTLTKEAFQIMKQSATFNALAVFYGQGSDDWRLSFLTANPEKTEKGKVTLAYSNPRRYSFFLGPSAKINTPYRFLIKNGQIKDYEDLLSRFNVEIVTKEFFENYKKLFDRLYGYLNKDHAFQAFASRNGVDTTNFAKKLLGQIVFLYFLQRKGWLGAKKSDSISAGDKDFLRSLFTKSLEKKANFYNEYLEKLFYGALNRPPEKAGSYYRSYFDCQIPFLNGGLFEPPQDYDWEGEFLLLPDKLFSSNPKDPSKGDGVLDIFDLYNFTVDESDFLDKEVSVDPEMLGKVFENLLEENLRKGKGTYYTPREIVNYMCEESVVNYLATETGMTPDDIKNKYFPSYNVLGDEKVGVRDVSVSEQIIESLKSIKVVDPACGSGAFLVGMLQQITHLRYELETRSKLLGRRTTASSEYEIKKQSIQNCIYGVDIDPGAVEIAKLRLWLSLVVDYDLEDIEPLPNLDYKIMQGNSLLEELVLGDTTIKLYDRQTIQKAVNSKRMKNLFDEDSQMAMFDDIKKEQTLKNMKALQVQYFSQSDANEKKKIKTQIEKIEHDLIEASVRAEADKLSAQRLNIRTLPGVGLLPEDAKRLMSISSKENQVMAVLDELNKSGTKPFFLWHLHFADVFEQKGGFDVAIANPPYVLSRESFSKEEKAYYKSHYKFIYEKPNLYLLFIERSDFLLNLNGTLAFIIPNSWLGVDSASRLRRHILENYSIRTIVNLLGETFESIGVEPSVLIYSKKKTSSKVKFATAKDKEISNTIYTESVQNEWFTNRNYLIDITSSSEEHFLLKKILQNSISLESKYDVRVGLQAYEKGKGEPKQTKEDVKNHVFDYSDKHDKHTFPYLHGKDVSKYLIRWSGMWLKYGKWLSQPKSFDQFSEPRILIREITSKFPNVLNCAFTDGVFINNKSILNILQVEKSYSLKFLLAYLNSILISFYHQRKTVKGNRLLFPKIVIRDLRKYPIPVISYQEQESFINLVDKILTITEPRDYLESREKQTQVREYERQINRMVYELYGLTKEEIEIIEGNGKK